MASGVALRAMSSAASSSSTRIAFCGLGAMGYPMAANITRKLDSQCIVWNRTLLKAEKHSKEFGSIFAANGFSDVATADIVLLCLPTSEEDAEVAEKLASLLSRGSCIVSCTSGAPTKTQKLASTVFEKYGVHLLDAPVSGGPAGAQAGTLACMMGANSEEAAARCIPVCEAFAKKVVRTGPVGSAHAVKSINNVMNCAHLLLASEGLLALQKLGVCPEVALAAINGSSGRSLQTEVRLPKEVLSREFNYGFNLSLMAKDVTIASDLLREGYPQAELLPTAAKLVREASAQNQGRHADYTRAVCLLEQRAGAEIRPRDASTPE